MLMVAFLTWWYGPGWKDAGTRLAKAIRTAYLSFSVPILLRTMFEPWRRITNYSTGSLQDRLVALVDNLVSRGVGFFVRLLALIAALIIIVFYGVLGGALLLLWPALPLIGPALIIGGLL